MYSEYRWRMIPSVNMLAVPTLMKREEARKSYDFGLRSDLNIKERYPNDHGVKRMQESSQPAADYPVSPHRREWRIPVTVDGPPDGRA